MEIKTSQKWKGKTMYLKLREKHQVDTKTI